MVPGLPDLAEAARADHLDEDVLADAVAGLWTVHALPFMDDMVTDDIACRASWFDMPRQRLANDEIIGRCGGETNDQHEPCEAARDTSARQPQREHNIQ